MPNWVQSGAIFNSLGYSNILINFISEGPAANGNDYAIDDVSLKEVILDSNIVKTSKSVTNLTNNTKLSANISDVLLYTISIANTSFDYSLVDITITDTISNGTSLVPGSIIRGSIISSTISNPLVISTATIAPGSFSSISFKVSVNNNITIPNIYNVASLKYGILVAENLTPAPGNINTNTTTIPVDIAILSIVKNVSPTTASNGDTITYTVNLENSGTVATNNILFTDIIPSGLIFTPGSFYINNINVPTISTINSSIYTTLPNILANNTLTISFSAVVNTISQATIINTATVSYNYISKTTFSSTISDSATLTVSSIPIGSVSLTKSSLCSNMRICDTNTYTITIANSTSHDLTNVIFYDTLPCGVEYLKNTLTINSVNANIDNLRPMVSIGTIPNTVYSNTCSVNVINNKF